MWPFRRKNKRRAIEKVVAGLIIGAAISSIIGKKLIDKHGKEESEDEEK
jgi:hypothetical protein